MKQAQLLALAFFVAVIPMPVISAPQVPVIVEKLTTNARVITLGVAADGVAFGWTHQASARATRRQAYLIWVGSQPGAADVWDSGRVASLQLFDVSLASQHALQSGAPPQASTGLRPDRASQPLEVLLD